MRTESTDSGDLAGLFASAISDLADGNLMFPAPFDLASSAALAANVDSGEIAEKLFAVTAQRDTGYRVVIYATAPGVEDREVVNTTVTSTGLLLVLLDELIEEKLARTDEKETPSGG